MCQDDYPVHIWSGTVSVQTVPIQFGSVRTRVRPYLFRNGTIPPVNIRNWADQSVPEQVAPERALQNTGSRIGTERYGMSVTFTDMDRWSGTVPVPYRSKNASMDRVDISWHLVRNNRKDVTQTMVCVSLREKANPLTFFFECYQCWFHSMFSVSLICLFLQTLNHKDNEKYVLVLVQCHDGIITNSINLVCVLHESKTSARPNRFISFVIIASWHRIRTRT